MISRSSDQDLDRAVLDLGVLAQLRELGRDVHDDRFLVELVEHFVADSEVRLRSVRAAVGGVRPDALARSIHALKGAAAQLGGGRLVAACDHVEAAIGLDCACHLQEACAAVEREYESFRAALADGVDSA